jgi:alkane 1-monooxygenase
MEGVLLEKSKKNNFFDWVMYLVIPLQWVVLVYFFFVIEETTFGTVTYFGRIFSMGLMCGVLGINVGHELGHRNKRFEQFLGEVLLLSSFNTHFLPYHNAGHHYQVATPNDAATAKKNQSLFVFWFSSHFGSYFKAWKVENKRMLNKGRGILSFHNRMISYSIANIILVSSIFYFFGATVLLSFLLASTFGIVLLETVNYIEHYGLQRKKNELGVFERVSHIHSWNSDHILGRFLLFNLSRHSDHHYRGSKKYQTLMSISESPQMPTGYPGMMLLALAQPLWFWLMNRKLKELEAVQSTLT